MGKGKKRKLETREKDNDANEFNLPAKFLASSHIRSNEKRLIIILDGAQLETVKVSQPSWLTPCYFNHISPTSNRLAMSLNC